MTNPTTPSKTYRKSISYLIYFVAICCCALGGAMVKYSPFGPGGTAAWRVALAIIMMAPFVWGQLRRTGKREALSLLAGGLLYGANLLLWNMSLVNTTQANSHLLANMHIFFTVPACWLLYRERPGRGFYLGLAAAIVGTLLLVFGKLAPSQGAVAGDIQALACTAFYAGYMLAVYRARLRAPVGAALFYIALGGLLVLIPAMLISEGLVVPHTWEEFLPLLGLTLVGHLGGVGLVTYSLYRISAGIASTLSLAQPAIGALLGFLLFGESLSWQEAAGMVVVTIGVYIAQSHLPHAAEPRRERS